jgi:hypothetical protein
MNQVQRPRPNGSQTEKLVYFPRSDGSRIPYKVYSSQELYDLEQERIFRGPVWSFVALEAEIRNPGDFKSTFVGDIPVVVTRNDDGSLLDVGQSMRSSGRHGLPRGARQREKSHLRLPSMELRHSRQFERRAFSQRD